MWPWCCCPQPAFLFRFTPPCSLPEPTRLKGVDETSGCGSKASQSLVWSLVNDKGLTSHSTAIPFIILIWKVGAQERDVSSRESKTKHS